MHRLARHFAGTVRIPGILLGFALMLDVARSGAASLEIQIRPTVLGEAVQPGSLRYETSAKEIFSITRVSFLASEFALQRPDGSWLEISNSVAWMDPAANRDSICLRDIPSGQFSAVRFLIGLNTNLNHADPAQFPANHPLNPNLNHLHWSWQGGYIFLALEGLWRNASGQFDGWAYHLARDTNAVRVTIATPLTVIHLTKVELDFDIGALLNVPQALSFARDGTSTHSRDGDPVSAALVANLPGAFRVRRVSALSKNEIAAANPKPLYLPAKFTPYAFQLNATFPIPDLSRDNPLIVERVALGEQLFHDAALSRDGTIACSSCHQEANAFSDPRRFSVGIEGHTGLRHAMPLVNLAWKNSFFWDGRAPSLRAQALTPIQDDGEMGETLTNLVAKLSATTNYPARFETAFGSTEISAEKIGLALEQYLLTLTSGEAKFDRVLRGQEKFTASEQHGFELFSTEYDPRRGQFGADCFHCHGGPLFRSQTFANNGLDVVFTDIGRAKVTGLVTDQGKFAVPSLRNVELTGPYMHDGRFKTLREAVEHYATDVKRSATLDPNLAKHPDGGVPLKAADIDALVAFLKTLTSERFQQTTNAVVVSR